MKNEKRRKAEKIQDKLEPEKVLTRNLARVIDRLDEHTDIQLHLTALLEGTKSLKVENLDEVKIPSSFIISNLKDIPFPETKLPDVFPVKIAEKPDWYKEPAAIPEFPKFPEKIAIDWENAPQPKQSEEAPPWIVGVITTAFAKLAELWSKGITTRRAEDDRLKPQMSVLIDPDTGKPMSAKDLRPIVNVEQRIPPSGAGSSTDVTDRAARLLGVVYGNLDKLQQRATTLELLTWDKNLETVLGTASLLNAGRLKTEAAPATGQTFPTSNAASSQVDGHSVSIGATTDVEATGNGSLIAILKRIRTLLGGTGSLSAKTQDGLGNNITSELAASGTDRGLHASEIVKLTTTGNLQNVNTTYNDVTTSANSENINCERYRKFTLYYHIENAGTPTDLQIIIQFSHDGGTTWFDYMNDQFGDLRFSNASTDTAINECVTGDCIAPLMRIRVVATGTTSINTFTTSGMRLTLKN